MRLDESEATLAFIGALAEIGIERDESLQQRDALARDSKMPSRTDGIATAPASISSDARVRA